jgi:hypothetical protein
VATTRGFVQAIEVGRAGLVRITLILQDASQAVFVIEDLDADPERFNERLSKLGILRDAMNRAEPVEIEHRPGDAGSSIDRVVRITRDALESPQRVESLAGLVVDVLVHSENAVTGPAERHDRAIVTLLGTDLATRQCHLDLQAPERIVADRQLAMIQEAHARGRLVRLLVDTAAKEGPRIVAVATDNDDTVFGGDLARTVDGFVEGLSLIRLPTAGGAAASSFAHVRFTTAPPFVGAGNIVSSAPFTPQALDLLVAKGSLTYDLFEAGLRDNLRMRVGVVLYRDGREDRPPRGTDQPAAGKAPPASLSGRTVLRLLSPDRASRTDAEAKAATVGLAHAAELLAPLASASRPVWIVIARHSLDHGPDGGDCTPGTPSSDLSPKGLRDLRIPYDAEWRGVACFNHGVYRFQLALPTPFTLRVDGDELCLYDSDDPGIKLAYACLGGEHEVVVGVEGWRCDYEFTMDVYRVR